MKIGIWERGAGETAASGTGSAASMVAARLNGKVDEKVIVRSPGGALEVDWRGGENITVIGEAVVVAEGDLFGHGVIGSTEAFLVPQPNEQFLLQCLGCHEGVRHVSGFECGPNRICTSHVNIRVLVAPSAPSGP